MYWHALPSAPTRLTSPSPSFTQQTGVNIDQGWHPVVKAASKDAFIANDVDAW